jgi:hypothetical protein
MPLIPRVAKYLGSASVGAWDLSHVQHRISGRRMSHTRLWHTSSRKQVEGSWIFLAQGRYTAGDGKSAVEVINKPRRMQRTGICEVTTPYRGARGACTENSIDEHSYVILDVDTAGEDGPCVIKIAEVGRHTRDTTPSADLRIGF